MRHVHCSSIFNAKAFNGVTQRTTGERAISLLEELFPPSSNRKKSLPQKRPERHIPKLALDTGIAPADVVPKTDTGEQTRREDLRRHNRELAVLVLRKASRFLTESDFRSAMPTGKHIEGWAHRGEILKVIRGRNPITLVPRNDYFLVFSTPSSATAYRDHAYALHRLAKAYLPSGLIGPIPLPPIPSPTGDLTYGAPDTFTLIPPSQDLDLRLTIQPFSPLFKSVIDASGYAPLVDGRQSDHEVLITVDGLHLSSFAIRGALTHDNRVRGTQWNTVGAHAGIREMVLPKSDEGDTRRPKRPAVTERRPERGGAGRFIVSFRDGDEAKRFAGAWHRRDISPLLEDLAMRGQEVFVSAEVIW